MWIVPWDLLLKLNLHFSRVADSMSSAHGPTKKNAAALNSAKHVIQTHT